MDKTLEEELLASFAAVAGGDEPEASQFVEWLRGAVTQNGAGTASGTPAPAVTATQNASSGGGAGSTLTTAAKSGFGLLPLMGVLFGLFGGGGESAPAAPAKYAMPARLEVEGAATEAGWSDVDYDQFGMPRGYAPGFARTPIPTPGDARAGGAAESEQVPAAAPQITVNVQAMDARSFLDRSGEIAAAVRNAMLNLNSINDVVNDL